MGTVIFDLDGTLADTSGDLIAAANSCFQQMGHGEVLCMQRDRSVAFRGGRAMLTEGLTRLGQYDAQMVERYYPELLAAYGAAIDVHTRLYPGAIEAVEALSALGYRVGICTNKPEGLAETLLDRLGVRGQFAALIGADTLPVRKPDAAPFVEAVRRAGGEGGKACLIGDTTTDRETARAAGIPCILVTFGPEGRKVTDLEPEALLDDFADLPDLVSELIPLER
ncbi:phosphoglycolate phosphatase [Poseidonocella pacifica]|uniref:phosphoglycolate phosphatase n=1 Tax=Poseidonocella pacifica TaxID=871651 RepID=A0A1I0XHQ2_9RHOB|nr:HAD-IA family hydrolase [Poseidonocella pacifica]SFA99768.1 phosphoglycolate phosphatase [Poseidonocella pacifica]